MGLNSTSSPNDDCLVFHVVYLVLPSFIAVVFIIKASQPSSLMENDFKLASWFISNPFLSDDFHGILYIQRTRSDCGQWQQSSTINGVRCKLGKGFRKHPQTKKKEATSFRPDRFGASVAIPRTEKELCFLVSKDEIVSTELNRETQRKRERERERGEKPDGGRNSVDVAEEDAQPPEKGQTVVGGLAADLGVLPGLRAAAAVQIDAQLAPPAAAHLHFVVDATCKNKTEQTNEPTFHRQWIRLDDGDCSIGCWLTVGQGVAVVGRAQLPREPAVLESGARTRNDDEQNGQVRRAARQVEPPRQTARRAPLYKKKIDHQNQHSHKKTPAQLMLFPIHD